MSEYDKIMYEIQFSKRSLIELNRILKLNNKLK